ncbi:helix-turn-helix domain-containing protein [Granulicella sp. L60]|uniref:helix-turn-helix domain-containing protein n=1 Tax=Granulicella sp. L60 TaxID=1641866 RepID=UPI00352ABFBC
MHFLRRFRKATAVKPTDYCQRLRVGIARELLESGKQSIEKISRTVGYENPASFRRIFCRIMGLSPSAYRNLLAGVPAIKREPPPW